MPLIKKPVSKGKSSFLLRTEPTVWLEMAINKKTKKNMALSAGGIDSWPPLACVALWLPLSAAMVAAGLEW